MMKMEKASLRGVQEKPQKPASSSDLVHLPGVSGLLLKGSMKKSLIKAINKGKKESEFISVHIQPPWMWCWLNTFCHILWRLEFYLFTEIRNSF